MIHTEELKSNRVLTWRLIKEYKHFNLWETTNTFYYERGNSLKASIIGGVAVPNPYRECFEKGIDPNKERYVRSSGNSRLLCSTRRLGNIGE